MPGLRTATGQRLLRRRSGRRTILHRGEAASFLPGGPHRVRRPRRGAGPPSGAGDRRRGLRHRGKGPSPGPQVLSCAVTYSDQAAFSLSLPPTTTVERSSRRPPAAAAQCAVWTCCWPSCWTAAPWTSCPEVGSHRTHRGGICMYALIGPLCSVAQLRTRPASSSLSRSGCPHSPCSHDLTLIVYVWCPSQPLHSCLFPHSSRFSSFHRTTNPMSCRLDGSILVVGHSGQVTLTLTSPP